VTDLSLDAADDGFHEIQLSGKQLVFLFMATTVVSVVIFLCGVLVGRGVRGDTVRADATPPAASGAGPTPTKVADPPPAPVDSAAPGTLSYQKRLDSATPVPERLKTPEPAAAAVTSKPAVEPAPAAKEVAPAPKPAAPAPATASTPSPSPSPSAKSGVWAVQVVALTDKAAASAVVQRLSAKGYPAFLVSPQSGAPVQNYKVQVGKFEDRAEAEQIAGRLKKEEQFQPWILR
jgi:DedD protein